MKWHVHLPGGRRGFTVWGGDELDSMELNRADRRAVMQLQRLQTHEDIHGRLWQRV